MEQRLAHLEAQLERVLVMLQSLSEKMADRIDATDSWKEKYDKLLYGDNGTKGLVVRLDRLEQAHERSKWLIRSVSAAVISLLVGAVWALLH